MRVHALDHAEAGVAENVGELHRVHPTAQRFGGEAVPEQMWMNALLHADGVGEVAHKLQLAPLPEYPPKGALFLLAHLLNAFSVPSFGFGQRSVVP